ncbi:FecR family protein [Sphingobacterium sp. DR205]|uniref:FecR family protein n=1 Tax=Sphingobacterium sp. DR205 TaxID=2713573 RepID=UPI0013E4488A|nr:FecR family protein [Sphingobacterium sp. DR205]QIH31616.1 FecR family protein [Sphingobacterium sp. DR205]
MTEEKLMSFILGKVCDVDKKAILKWIYASPDNFKYYLEVRKIYDLSLLNIEFSIPNDIENSYADLLTKIENNGTLAGSRKRFTRGVIKYAAIVFLVSLSAYVIFFVKSETKAINYTSITTIKDSQTNVKLPDGTEVKLNPNSKLTYPSDFGNKERSVSLVGEAQFHVTKGKKIPFIVKTESHDVKVLGTTFNVYAYKNSNFFEVVLMEGAVRVENKTKESSYQTIKPGELLQYNKSLGKTTIKLINDSCSSTSFWGDKGLFSFHDMRLIDILDRISKYKGLVVRVENRNLNQAKYTGKFKSTLNIKQILDVMNADKSFLYRIDNDTIYIR